MYKTDTELALIPDDLSAQWKVDSTKGGIVDLALVAEVNGTEIGRSTIRVSSIPCAPTDGRIIFVNPYKIGLGDAAPPYNLCLYNAADNISDASIEMRCSSSVPDDNLVVLRGTYFEDTLWISRRGVVAGLGGRWTAADPVSTDVNGAITPLADSFDFTELPTVQGKETGAGVSPIFLSSGPVFSSGPLTFSGLSLTKGNASVVTHDTGGAIALENITEPVRISFCNFDSNRSVRDGGAVS